MSDPQPSDSDGGIAHILGAAAAEQFSGVVESSQGARLWLENGELYFAEKPGSPDIAEVIFAAKVGTLDDIVELLERPESDTIAVLIERHPHAKGELARLLHEHILGVLFELTVTAANGWTPRPTPRHPLGASLAEPVADLLDAVAQRMVIWKEIAAAVPSMAATFRLADELPDELTERVVGRDEWRYLALIARGATVSDLISSTGASAFGAMATVYRLLLEGLIHPKN